GARPDRALPYRRRRPLRGQARRSGAGVGRAAPGLRGGPRSLSDRAGAYGEDLAHVHAAGFLWVAEEAARFAIDALAAAGIDRATVVELGCGSGQTAARLGAAGPAGNGTGRRPHSHA